MKLDQSLVFKILDYSETHFIDKRLGVTPDMFETDMDTFKYHIHTLLEEEYIDAFIYHKPSQKTTNYTPSIIVVETVGHEIIISLGKLTMKGHEYLQNLRRSKPDNESLNIPDDLLNSPD